MYQSCQPGDPGSEAYGYQLLKTGFAGPKMGKKLIYKRSSVTFTTQRPATKPLEPKQEHTTWVFLLPLRPEGSYYGKAQFDGKFWRPRYQLLAIRPCHDLCEITGDFRGRDYPYIELLSDVVHSCSYMLADEERYKNWFTLHEGRYQQMKEQEQVAKGKVPCFLDESSQGYSRYSSSDD